MAVFPQVPRVIKVELYVNNAWTDISPDVYVRNSGNITIIRGGQDEQNRPGPQSCTLVIDNRSGNYSPRNPVGIYSGFIGRNTPIRVAVELAGDTFTRTATSSWGTSDTGRTYTLTGAGGAISAANWNVSGGVGTIALTSTSISRTSTIVGFSLQDVDVSTTVTMPFSAVTGASIYPVIVKLRDQGGTNYYYARTVVTTTGAVQIGLRRGDGTGIVADTTVPGLTFTGQALSMRFQTEGQTLRAKSWDATVGEPYDWQIIANDTAVPAAGLIGVTSWVLGGNTNTLPIVVSYDNLLVRSPRFFGEVASWPQQWDITGLDAFVPITAAGIKRRLGQNQAPMRSALYRHYAQLATPPTAYWSCEDLPSSQDFASAVGGTPLVPSFSSAGASVALINDEWVKFASDASYLGSNPLPVCPAVATVGPLNAGPVLTGVPTVFVDTGTVLVRFLLTAPLNDTGNPEPNVGGGATMISVLGFSSSWHIGYEAGGFVSLTNSAGFYSGPFSVGGISDIRGHPLLYSLLLTDTGGNVNYSLRVLEVAATTSNGILVMSGTRPGVQVDGVFQVIINSGESLYGFPTGHVAVRTEGTSGVTDIFQPLNGWSGEAAGVRMQRLCAEEVVPFYYRGNITQSSLVGPQGSGAVTSGVATTNSLVTPGTSQTFLDLLNEAEDVDRGILYEPRGALGLEYRTRSDLYTQPVTLNLDYSLGQVAPPFLPIDDDQNTQNNIIVTRVNGQSAEAELTTGRLSTRTPSDGGVGNYNVPLTLNVASDEQLADLATFLLIMGTVDEPRYPTISVNLANPNTVTAGLETNVLAVNIGDVLAVNNPRTIVTPDQIRQIVRGYTEVLAQYTHTLTFNSAPESPYRLAKLNAIPVMRFQADSSALTAGVSSSATSLSVSSVGALWTTDPAEMPIPIIIAGEQMSVTAISGTSSPQTLTVTRSTNSVVKPQASGAAVNLFVPMRLAY